MRGADLQREECPCGGRIPNRPGLVMAHVEGQGDETHSSIFTYELKLRSPSVFSFGREEQRRRKRQGEATCIPPFRG